MEAAPIQLESFKLGFIGAGKMAESIARGVVQSGVLPPQRISTAILSNPNRGIPFQSLGISVQSHNDELNNAVSQLKPLLSKKKRLVSISAAVKLKDLEEWAGHGRLIRVMPNTPSAVGMGASVMSLGGAATEQDGELVGKLFGSIGKI